MDRRAATDAFGTATSTAIGKLIVRLRNDGLFTSDDVQSVLRSVLANAAPVISAGAPAQATFADAIYQSYAAAE